MNMKKARGSLPVLLLFHLMGIVALSHAYSLGPAPGWGRGTTRTRHPGDGDKVSSRAQFVQSIGTLTCILVSSPSVAVATPSDTLQASFDSLNREVSNLDRVVAKQAKKIDRAVSKKTNKVAKEVRQDLKKMDRVVTKETKKVMRKVDKETTVAKREAKKLGTEVENKSKALIGNVLPTETAGQKLTSKGGIDVSRLKVCTDVSKKCL
jgi:hypothetical protein